MIRLESHYDLARHQYDIMAELVIQEKPLPQGKYLDAREVYDALNAYGARITINAEALSELDGVEWVVKRLATVIAEEAIKQAVERDPEIYRKLLRTN